MSSHHSSDTQLIFELIQIKSDIFLSGEKIHCAQNTNQIRLIKPKINAKRNCAKLIMQQINFGAIYFGNREPTIPPLK